MWSLIKAGSIQEVSTMVKFIPGQRWVQKIKILAMFNPRLKTEISEYKCGAYIWETIQLHFTYLGLNFGKEG